MEREIGKVFLEESRNRAEAAWRRIEHALSQIDDEEVWWTPSEGSNSVGVIIQHLQGNLRQWAMSGVGGVPDSRDRPAEFVVRERSTKLEIQDRLRAVMDAAAAVYARVPVESLLDVVTIQGFRLSRLSAMYSTMTHLDQHAGQICYIARMLRGKGYKEYWRPASREEGA